MRCRLRGLARRRRARVFSAAARAAAGAGSLLAILLVSFAVVWAHVAAPISPPHAAAMALHYVVEFAAYGMIVGAIYKPIRRRPGRNVT